MLAVTNNSKTAIQASKRQLAARVELYEGSTLKATYTHTDAIKSITIDRTGEESKFFGFSVTHRFNIKLRDVPRTINVSTANHFKISLGLNVNGTYEYVSYPLAYVTEVNRDENTNELSITAYDLLNSTKTLLQSDLALTTPYSIKNVSDAVAVKLGTNSAYVNIPDVMLCVPLASYAGDSYTSNGITFTRNSDGSLTLNGTNDGVNNSAYYFYNEVAGGEPLTLEVGETYAASDFEDEDIMFVFFTGEYYRKKDGQTFTATEDEHVFPQVYIQIPKGNTTVFENYTIRPTLKKQATMFDIEYPTGANFDGSETLQEVLKAITEATQTICYVNASNQLVFKRLDRDGAAVKTITKEHYFDLDSGTNKRLQTIASITELGDNVNASTTQIGTTQYIRDNAFLDLREEIAELMEAAVEVIGNITINQFSCKWRGDMAVEVGDKISLVTKNNEIVTTYLLSDSITYDGALEESSGWKYTEEEKVDSNPSSIGELIKETYAKVDKANKRIDIVASESSAHADAISSLQMSTESINASVKSIESNTEELIENLNTDIAALTKEVETKITAEDVNIAIKSELDNGVSKVTTETGFTFDENGLHIAKTGSEMTTTVDEDGISVYKDGDEVLTADNKGVIAYDLHAKTYLIVGESSRFEDYEKDGEQRTGCFWIGGSN